MLLRDASAHTRLRLASAWAGHPNAVAAARAMSRHEGHRRAEWPVGLRHVRDRKAYSTDVLGQAVAEAARPTGVT